MRRPKWMKVAYWIGLAVAGGWLVVWRFRSGAAGYPTTMDVMAFAAELLLLLAPLFEEIKVGELSVKRAVENAKAEIKEEMTSIRTEVQSIRLNAQATSHVYVGPLPSEAQLTAVRQEVEAALRGSPGSESEQIMSGVPDYVADLARLRVALEAQARRIARHWLFNTEEQRPAIPFSVIVRDLEAEGAITPTVRQAARDVYNICSAALHAADLTERQVAFARDTGPGIVSVLKTL